MTLFACAFTLMGLPVPLWFWVIGFIFDGIGLAMVDRPVVGFGDDQNLNDPTRPGHYKHD